MVLTIISAVLVAVVAGIFKSEVEAWMPHFSEWLRRLALRPFQGAIRERLDEEWAAYLDDVPGNLGKLVCASGFVLAAYKIGMAAAARRSAYHGSERVMGFVFACANRLADAFSHFNRRADEGQFTSRIERILYVWTVHSYLAGFRLCAWRVCLIDDPSEREAETVRIGSAMKDLKANIDEILMRREAL